MVKTSALSSKQFAFSGVSTRRKTKEALQDPLFLVDDTPEFYDPFSSLNVYLAQEIQKHWRSFGCKMTWSLSLQEELVRAVSPGFQRAFPQYRLSITALKKTWEKVIALAQYVQEHPEAVAQDGKLNVFFLVREHCKETMRTRSHVQHLWHFAQGIAVKICESCALVDGVWPDIEWLTRLICITQHHLLPRERLAESNEEYDACDAMDIFIMKAVVHALALEPQLAHKELEYKVKGALQSLRELPSFASLESIENNTAALLAEKLYPSCAFHTRFLGEQKRAMHQFFRRHTALCKRAETHMHLSAIVRRTISLYTLASTLPKEIPQEVFNQAVDACYPITKRERPALPQKVYAFISAELTLMRNEAFCPAPSFVAEVLWKAYRETAMLPPLEGSERETLEIVLWKDLSETEGLLEKLPYSIGKRIEEEMGHLVIENPRLSFSSLVRMTVQSFQHMRALAQQQGNDSEEKIERRIRLWAAQGDMLCRWIGADAQTPLLRLICEKACTSTLSHERLVHDVCQEYLAAYPELIPYAQQVHTRSAILYKYAWYALFGAPEESPFERFLKWHARSFFACATLCETSQVDNCVQKLRGQVEKMLPLIAFDEKACADGIM